MMISTDGAMNAAGVPNIRLAFARAMFCTRGGEVFRAKAGREDVRNALEVMLDDSDSDCRRTARKALGMPDSENNFQVSALPRPHIFTVAINMMLFVS